MNYTHPLSAPFDQLTRALRGARAALIGTQNGQGTETSGCLKVSDGLDQGSSETLKKDLAPDPNELEAFSDDEAADKASHTSWSAVELVDAPAKQKHQARTAQKRAMTLSTEGKNTAEECHDRAQPHSQTAITCLDCKQSLKRSNSRNERGYEADDFVMVYPPRRGWDYGQAIEKGDMSSQLSQ